MSSPIRDSTDIGFLMTQTIRDLDRFFSDVFFHFEFRGVGMDGGRQRRFNHHHHHPFSTSC